MAVLIEDALADLHADLSRNESVSNESFQTLLVKNHSSSLANWFYGIFLLVGLSGNLVFLRSLIGTPEGKARLRPFLLNLCIADLLVCCFTITMEIGWRMTVVWTAGDAACRLFSFTKTFGLYLATFVVVGMSIDRCYAIWFPMKLNDGPRRARIVLTFVWISAFVCSLPQALIYHVESYPNVPEFTQCVTFFYFATEAGERGYVIFGVLAMYVIPLQMIIVVNAIILWNLRTSIHIRAPKMKRSFTSAYLTSDYTHDSEADSIRTNYEPETPNAPSPAAPTATTSATGIALSIVTFKQSTRGSHMRLSTGLILYHSSRLKRQRTRTRTVKLSLLIVAGFVLCYTPYAVITVWSLFVETPENFHEQITDGVTEGLLLFTMSFSTIINPIVYGSYMIYARGGGCRNWFSHFYKPVAKR
ncbi:adipokinetic hormone/corazonin-related peptide receptor variant I-like [Paramacrobiotus metropolitanus]|uniref:adipokinetic hormone/corazonin-related peptide receptor variant I-like n=1 Tax=Paramacrobiotus metropolitanus TaxID=2943436 RepID=UPI0024461179|nr:adipokinetic hormone/corazonin-related peptide receptor variant I-like [Paramacrobiotus metropolitanus]